jgi:hypothetical protein
MYRKQRRIATPTPHLARQRHSIASEARAALTVRRTYVPALKAAHTIFVCLVTVAAAAVSALRCNNARLPYRWAPQTRKKVRRTRSVERASV